MWVHNHSPDLVRGLCTKLIEVSKYIKSSQENIHVGKKHEIGTIREVIDVVVVRKRRYTQIQLPLVISGIELFLVQPCWEKRVFIPFHRWGRPRSLFVVVQDIGWKLV